MKPSSCTGAASTAVQRSRRPDERRRRLTDLYLRTNHFDRLVSRLESLARDLDNQRDITICLANAYSSAGDLGTARITLEGLVGDDSRDVQLLTQLVRLAELKEDFEGGHTAVSAAHERAGAFV